MIKVSIQNPDQWSIGIYKMTWESLNHFVFHDIPDVKNPVLNVKTIAKRGIQFVADPFLIQENNKYYIFFEIMHYHKGTIGLAESEDGIQWNYKGTILEEPFHMSYPCVVKDNNAFYMVPECAKTNSMRLYKASQFPNKWTFVKEIACGIPFADPTVFLYKQTWWLMVSDITSSNLYLYRANQLEGEWVPHKKNPILQNNKSRARSGGNVLQILDKTIMFFQDSSVDYGRTLRLFEVTMLDENDFQCEEIDNSCIENLKVASWNRDGIHHISNLRIDKGSWLIAIDGKTKHKPNYVYTYMGNIALPIAQPIVKLYHWLGFKSRK